ncbi:hypothetical protein HYZ78_01370 [Candidatus Microgenomates bacterium]|nr:hypothetical protein [Candidatus Microgenomates bacterium]
MIATLGNLNDEQIKGLANLFFDITKASFVLTILPAPNIPENPLLNLFKMLIGLIWGLALTYTALLLLNSKVKP